MSVNKKDSTGVTEKLEDFFRKKLENEIEIKDKHQYQDLIKSSWDDSEIKLKRGSRDLSKKALNRILKEKGIEAPDGIFKTKKSGVVGEIEATFDGAGKKMEKIMGVQENLNQPSSNQGYGIFGNPNQPQQQIQSPIPQSPQTIIVQKSLSEAEKASNKRFLKQSMQIPKRLWVEFGIVDAEDLGEKEKPTTWSEQYDEWVESLADICNEHGYSFPAKMELILAGVTGISLLVLPLIMKMMGKSADSKKEKKKRKEKNELDELLENEVIA